jgi:hypothetical protein
MSHLRDVTLTKKDTINLKRKSLLYLLFRDVEVWRHRLENGRITCPARTSIIKALHQKAWLRKSSNSRSQALRYLAKVGAVDYLDLE